jgi:ribosome biogenesis GTPase
MLLCAELGIVKDDEKKGILCAHYGVAVDVRLSHGEVLEKIRVGRKSGHVVGDEVVVKAGTLKRLPRHSELKRRSSFGRTRVMAANLDGLGLVVACEPAPPRDFLDAGIVAARDGGMIPFVVVNKADLSPSAELATRLRALLGPDIGIFEVSAQEGAGLDGLSGHLAQWSLVALVGPSGVGKSSLVNALVPDADLLVGQVSEASGHGKHTTTRSTLLPLPGGGHLVDTPGIREMGMADVQAEALAHHFAGFDHLDLQPCRYRNCLHRDEPGCAIKNAAEMGALDEDRYQTYLRLLDAVVDEAQER